MDCVLSVSVSLLVSLVCSVIVAIPYYFSVIKQFDKAALHISPVKKSHLENEWFNTAQFLVKVFQLADYYFFYYYYFCIAEGKKITLPSLLFIIFSCGNQLIYTVCCCRKFSDCRRERYTSYSGRFYDAADNLTCGNQRVRSCKSLHFENTPIQIYRKFYLQKL